MIDYNTKLFNDVPARSERMARKVRAFLFDSNYGDVEHHEIYTVPGLWLLRPDVRHTAHVFACDPRDMDSEDVSFFKQLIAENTVPVQY